MTLCCNRVWLALLTAMSVVVWININVDVMWYLSEWLFIKTLKQPFFSLFCGNSFNFEEILRRNCLNWKLCETISWTTKWELHYTMILLYIWSAITKKQRMPDGVEFPIRFPTTGLGFVIAMMVCVCLFMASAKTYILLPSTWRL